MTGEFRSYIAANKAAAEKLAQQAAEEYELAESRVARQWWVQQGLYWTQRVDYWARRQEEEDKYD